MPSPLNHLKLIKVNKINQSQYPHFYTYKNKVNIPI